MEPHIEVTLVCSVCHAKSTLRLDAFESSDYDPGHLWFDHLRLFKRAGWVLHINPRTLSRFRTCPDCTDFSAGD